MISRHPQTLFQHSKTSSQILHLYAYLHKTSLDHHEFFFSNLIRSAVSVSLHHARKLFQESPATPQPLFAWNTLIRAYSTKSSTPIESIRLFKELLQTPSGLEANKFTYPFVIKACGRCSLLGVGGSVHSMVVKVGLNLDSHVNVTLLTMYAGCGVIGFSRKVFDEMCVKNVITWSSMIGAYVHCSRDLDALKVFNDMRRANEEPNSITLVSLLAACANLLDIRLGKSIHTHILIKGIELHVGLGTSLLRFYAKSGHLEEACHVFRSCNEKNLQSWTIMITCLAENGYGEEAVSLFTEMTEAGFMPDSISFTAILSACRHKGLVLESQELFDQMVNVYNIMPSVEHYGCMVDLFGRAGKIEDAYKIILSMPMEPNAVILRCYLSACKHHGRVLFADKHLMQLLLKLEPDIGANYVLAATASSTPEYVDVIIKMRDDMKVKGLKKNPGQSWVLRPRNYMTNTRESALR